MQQTNSGRKLKLTLTTPSKLLNYLVLWLWLWTEFSSGLFLFRHLWFTMHLPLFHVKLSVPFSKRIIFVNAKASYVVQSLNLSNHKAQSEVWNIAGWSNGSRARCEDEWQPPPIREEHHTIHTPGLGVTTKHWDQRKLNFKQTVSEFIPEMWILNGLGMWGAWWREECCGWSAYLSPLHTFLISMRSDSRASVMKVL